MAQDRNRNLNPSLLSLITLHPSVTLPAWALGDKAKGKDFLLFWWCLPYFSSFYIGLKKDD